MKETRIEFYIGEIVSRKFGKVWDYPTQRKFRRVTAIADDGNIAKGESYEIAKKFRRNGEVWYELKGAGEHRGDIFAVTYSTLGEAKDKDWCGTTKLSRRFAKRYVELSGRPESEVIKKLGDEFDLHEFTVKRLTREARQLRMKYGKKFEGMLESRLLWGKNVNEYEELREFVRSIVFSETVLSDSGTLASQKFRTRNILTEKEETDVQYRALNQKYANKIEKYLQTQPELEKIGNRSLALPGIEVDPRLGDLLMIFRPSEGATHWSFGRLTADPSIKVIIAPLLRGDYDQKNLDTRFGAHKENFGHEFTHYVDEKRRTSGKQRSIDILKSKGEEAYYNTPEEFNAFYQDGVTKLLKIAKGLKKADINIKSKLFPPDVKKFLKGGERPKKIWGNDFISKMSPKYRKKFAKRVGDLFPKVINTVYTEKERASLSRHLAKKRAEQKFYCN